LIIEVCQLQQTPGEQEHAHLHEREDLSLKNLVGLVVAIHPKGTSGCAAR
jgi:hypothetical protein